MERKIGEIFEYNGEWYQCLKSASCDECAFLNSNCIDNPSLKCSVDDRNDNCSVIFKKLEKVGEPKIINGKKVQLLKSKYCKNCDFWDNNDCTFTTYPRTCMGGEYGVYVEIKQNKEDMKENHKAEDTLLTRLVGRYVNNLIDYETFEKAVKELYSDKKDSKPTLKEFDLEAAKVGKPVYTRDGRKARIICFNMNSFNNHVIVALITEENGTESIYSYTSEGKWKETETENDLMMLPEKKEGWVNVYKERCYESKEEAIKHIAPGTHYIDTIRVEWEE